MWFEEFVKIFDFCFYLFLGVDWVELGGEGCLEFVCLVDSFGVGVFGVLFEKFLFGFRVIFIEFRLIFMYLNLFFFYFI